MNDSAILKMLLALPITVPTEPKSNYIRNNPKYYALWSQTIKGLTHNG